MQGDAWGSNLQDFNNSWKSRTGWKSFVKTALKRHLLQEQLAFAIQKSNLAPPASSADPEHGGDYACFCGKTFPSVTSLSVHKRVVHQVNAPEFWLAQGSKCYTCQREFWTRSRLQQHLTYVSRKGKPNRCFTYQTLRPEIIDLDCEEYPLPDKIKGLRRHEALRLEGPLLFGMDERDGGWAQAEKERLENSLNQNFGIHNVDDHWRQDLEEVLEETYKVNKSFEQVLLALDAQGLEAKQEVTTLMLWGFQRTYEEKRTLLDWFMTT